MTYYVVVDIGCLECGEASACLGVFVDKADAQSVEAKANDEKGPTGQHEFVMFTVVS